MTTDRMMPPRWEPARPAPASGWRTVAGFAAGLLGCVVLGLPAGLIWGKVAPRAMLQQVSAGAAQLVSPETHAFIGADAWYCGIAAPIGLVAGIAGYWSLVRPRRDGGRAVVAGGLILGGVAGALIMMWVGQQVGLSAYHQHAASSAAGTVYSASLVLGAKSALAFWPGLTAMVILIAEWGARRGAAAGVMPPPGYGVSGS